MHLLIPAAGMGRRMGSDRNKLLLTISGKPLLARTLAAADLCDRVTWIGVMGQRSDFPEFEATIEDLSPRKPIELIQGGKTRQESVYNGLQALPAGAKRVLIHDGARCLASPALFDRCAQALLDCPGLIAAIPVKDTIKVVDETGTVRTTPDRAQLWAAQTPQGFEVSLLKDCHEQGKTLGWEVTDDAALFEKCGLPVKIVEGEETNLKVTTRVDLAIAELILGSR